MFSTENDLTLQDMFSEVIHGQDRTLSSGVLTLTNREFPVIALDHNTRDFSLNIEEVDWDITCIRCGCDLTLNRSEEDAMVCISCNEDISNGSL